MADCPPRLRMQIRLLEAVEVSPGFRRLHGDVACSECPLGDFTVARAPLPAKALQDQDLAAFGMSYTAGRNLCK